MHELFSIVVAAFGGGVVRGLIGYIKHQYSYKNVGFDVAYFLTMNMISGVIGS
jgi:ABC-type thiamin/hydroxymethylpyrimidine transport system permease subunit